MSEIETSPSLDRDRNEVSVCHKVVMFYMDFVFVCSLSMFFSL